MTHSMACGFGVVSKLLGQISSSPLFSPIARPWYLQATMNHKQLFPIAPSHLHPVRRQAVLIMDGIWIKKTTNTVEPFMNRYSRLGTH